MVEKEAKQKIYTLPAPLNNVFGHREAWAGVAGDPPRASAQEALDLPPRTGESAWRTELSTAQVSGRLLRG